MNKENLDDKRWQDTLAALDSLNNGGVIEGEYVHSWLKSWGSDSELQKPEK